MTMMMIRGVGAPARVIAVFVLGRTNGEDGKE